MGFIDYHGNKEDRYDDVVDFAHMQQEEDFLRKEDERIRKWLESLSIRGNLSEVTIADLLRNIIIKYQDLHRNGMEVFDESISSMTAEKIWEDFSMDLIMRHIEPFHLTTDKKEKFFDSFVMKVLKIASEEQAHRFYSNLAKHSGYRRYFMECYDPAWRGQQFFRYLQQCKKKTKKDVAGFLQKYQVLGMYISLYLNRAIHAKDSGWMLQEAEEWNALSELISLIDKGKLGKLNVEVFLNPLNGEAFTKEPREKSAQSTGDNGVIDHNRFDAYIKEGGIPNYINACILLLEAPLPEEMKEIYEELVQRMPILKETIDKFDAIYHADMDLFDTYYAPDALNITVTYLEYQAAHPSDDILSELRGEVLLAIKKLLLVVNEKIDEIYRYVVIDAKAEARALQAMMGQDGYVDPAFKIKVNGGNENE